jgi:hypothetical protein
MADWVTISSSLATAGGTLVLAVATFSSVKSANRSARVAEQSLLVGLRPVLIPSREEDPVQRIRFGDGVFVSVSGHGAAVEEHDGVIYLAIALRNGGSGVAVLHGWRAKARGETADPASGLEEFRRQQLDLYIPAGDNGYWQGALRDREQFGHAEVQEALRAREPIEVDLLYGDHEGGQRTIARFMISSWKEIEGEVPIDGAKRATLLRYFNVDGAVAR